MSFFNKEIRYTTTPNSAFGLKLETFNPNGKPSWSGPRRPFTGSVKAEVSIRAAKNFLQIMAEEMALPDDPKKRLHTKEVYLTFSREQGLALRDYLNEVYPLEDDIDSTPGKTFAEVQEETKRMTGFRFINPNKGEDK